MKNRHFFHFQIKNTPFRPRYYFRVYLRKNRLVFLFRILHNTRAHKYCQVSRLASSSFSSCEKSSFPICREKASMLIYTTYLRGLRKVRTTGWEALKARKKNPKWIPKTGWLCTEFQKYRYVPSQINSFEFCIDSWHTSLYSWKRQYSIFIHMILVRYFSLAFPSF